MYIHWFSYVKPSSCRNEGELENNDNRLFAYEQILIRLGNEFQFLWKIRRIITPVGVAPWHLFSESRSSRSLAAISNISSKPKERAETDLEHSGE